MNATRRGISIVVLAALAASVAGFACAARAEDAEESIVAAREAFGDGRFPWYDSQTDSLKPLEFRDRLEWKPPSWNLGRMLNIVAWTFLGLLLATLVVLLIHFARNQAARTSAGPVAESDRLLDADRVGSLPFLAERRRDDLLGQARFHYQQGNFSEAIIYLFSYQLLELDKYCVIRLATGKTNRQYLRETAGVAPLRTALERTMLSFEGVFFGRRPLDRAGFEACWNGLPEFEQHLRAVT
jgi:Domain of unknown function (DUF4129)